MIGPFVLAALLHSCALPLPSPLDAAQVGVIEVESGGNAWAIGDNNAHRSFYPRTFQSAVAIATALVAHDEAIHGDGIDLGIAQINSHNLAAHHLGVADVLHPCANIAISSDMLTQTFVAERTRFAAFAPAVRDYAALNATLQTYNSGRSYGDDRYTHSVLAAMRGRYVTTTIAALGGSNGSAESAVATGWRFIPAAPPGALRHNEQGAKRLAPRHPNEFVGSSGDIFSHKFSHE